MALNTEFGLTSTGFNVKRQPDILTDIQTDYVTLTAATGTPDISTQSVFGQLSSTFSKPVADLWEKFENIFLNNSIQASGVALDNVVSYIGMKRLKATATLATIACYTNVDNAISIPPNFVVQDPITSQQYIMNSTIAKTMKLANTVDINLKISAISSILTVSIAGTSYSYTPGGGATIFTSTAALVSAINAQTLMTAIDNLDGTFRIVSADYQSGYAITFTSNISLITYASPFLFTNTVTGPITCPSSSVTSIVGPTVSGLLSVNNLATGFTGRNIETDDALRYRHQNFKYVNAAGTLNAMTSRVQQEVPYVDSVTVFQYFTASGPIPANSFQCVVDCPVSVEQTVANKIWQLSPIGIQSYGLNTYSVIDAGGNTQTVKFSKPTLKYIWLRMTVTKSTETAFPNNGALLIQNSLYTLGNAMIMGQDVINQAFVGAAYNTAGIAAVSLVMAVTTTPGGTPSYGSAGANITIGVTEYAKFDPSRINVIIS